MPQVDRKFFPEEGRLVFLPISQISLKRSQCNHFIASLLNLDVKDTKLRYFVPFTNYMFKKIAPKCLDVSP